MNPEIDCNLLHPLMHVRPLDAPSKQHRGRSKNSCRNSLLRRSASAPSQGRELFLSRLEPSWNVSSSRVTRYNKKQRLLYENLSLSESDSESEDNDASSEKKKFSSSIGQEEETYCDVSFADDETLMDDLYLSDSSSSFSSTSEITGPSDTENEDCPLPKKTAEPLLDTEKGAAFFFIHKAPDVAVCEDFMSTALTEEPLTIVSRFRLLCRALPLDEASLMFANKVKSLPINKLIPLLRNLRPLFNEQRFSLEMTSDILFGNIIMTLIYHFYDKQVHLVNLKLLKLLTYYHLDPFKLRRFQKQSDIPQTNKKISNETDIGILCCKTYFASDDMKHCVKFLQRTLTNMFEENLTDDLIYVMLLVKEVFCKLLNDRETLPLTRLFSSIIDLQGNLEEPIDLTLYYEGVLAANVVKNDGNSHKRAFTLFEKVNYWGYVEVSGIVYRGLITAAALLNESQDRINDIFRMCVNTGVYPPHDTSKWIISMYSSMSKIEMQIYLVQCLQRYMKEIRINKLKMCSTYLTFKIVQVPPISRDYFHAAHPKLLQVDHSLTDTIRRLASVIYYYLKIPTDSCLHPYGGDRLIMFHDTVQELFKKSLKVNSFESVKENCIFCLKYRNLRA